MSVLQQTFSITLQDDCVFSERAATEGMHDTLDCIPGSALLGAAAAQLYAQLTAEQAYAAFHSGRLRFGNGLPEVDGALAWPVPMCWHYAKNDKPQRGLFDSHKLHNFLFKGAIKSEEKQTEEQAKPLRDGYVTAAGLWVKPMQNYRMKTAIDAATGRAADAQIFGYSALQRGQRFIASIEADADFDPALFSRVTQVLQGQVLLGRSRSAEYGRVRIRHDAAASVQFQPGPSQGQTLTLWLISDLAPCDAYGQPTLALDPLALGLPEASKIKWDKAFSRSRRYSPWNAKRHGFDAERQVFMAGGVLQVELPDGADAKAVAERLSQGIGLHREAGLGRVWVNPPLLATERPVFASAPQVIDSKPALRPDHPLIRWIEEGASTDDVEVEVSKMAANYRTIIESARLANGYPPDATDFYPSRSQWGSVLEAARSKRGSDLFTSLFGGNCVIKPNGKGWDLEIPPQGQSGNWVKLADWLKAKLSPPSQQTCDAIFVQQLARRLMDQPAKRKV